ncbi:MAG: acyl-CoA dehydratase activase [Dehalococcoidia bacterium]|nr:acyl-CoA dehydratase activase [Dehalococcoidia bacterium]MDH4299704.1 acyl-CoA dehydratase activase [Dehalococcoidia bacterium]MDH4367810.1 acyl-CoA dehydratase activase [Dehalococcoidia bacterium]
MTWFMGIDIGSAYSKGVITRDLELVVSHTIKSGADYRKSAEIIRTELIKKANLTQNDIANAVATGSGADNVYFAGQKASDIVCTARGISNVFPQARTVIDVASQSTKVIRLNEKGIVTNFTASEKCAAGSGRFIEVIANVLRIDLSDFDRLAARSTSPITFNTGCAVFGESEAITRISEGVSKEDIAAGVNKALASKISSLVNKVRLEQPCAICGGGALNTSLVKAIEDKLKARLLMPSCPQIIAALGAAIIAATPPASQSTKQT